MSPLPAPSLPPPAPADPNQDFLACVSLRPTYPRPAFVLPDLSSPDGNTREVAARVFDCLAQAGFRLEALALAGSGNPMLNFFTDALLFRTDYSTHPDLLSRFTALLPAGSPSSPTSPVRNLPLFAQLASASPDPLFSPAKLPSTFAARAAEFSALNNFSRHALYYAPLGSPTVARWLLARNHSHPFVDLFHLDVFHQSALRACVTPSTFLLLHQAMHQADPVRTRSLFVGQDAFGFSCFQSVRDLLAVLTKSVIPDERYVDLAGQLLGLCAFYAPPALQSEVLDPQLLQTYAQSRPGADPNALSLPALTATINHTLLALTLPEGSSNSPSSQFRL